jgi:CRP/FNR family transcriptional regulator, global nitrogen regulator
LPAKRRRTAREEARKGQRDLRSEIRRFERRVLIMINYHGEPHAPATGQPHLWVEGFAKAGLRVAERRFGTREIIYAPGDPDGHLHFLLEGTVRLYKMYGDCKEATTALLTEGDVFGELSLEETSHQNTFAEAVTDARVAVVRKSVLKEAIKRRPEFTLKLFSSFSKRFRQSDETIESLLNREVSARLVTLLSHLGERFGESDGSATIIKVRLTHQDLANMIFSTREAVSKEMSGFQRAGLIEVRNRRISVTPRLAKEGLNELRSNAGEAA